VSTPVADPTTEPNSQGAQAPLPADPEAFDSPRAERARARGLSAPYIAGGRDPDPESGRREERYYLRILVAMIVVVVAAGFVLGFLASAFGG
jgi:hypothetical protein